MRHDIRGIPRQLCDGHHSSSICQQTRELAWWRVQTKDVARLCVVAGLLSVCFTYHNRLGVLASRLVHTRITDRR